MSQLDMSLIMEKTEELCLAILKQPSFKEMKKSISDFVSNETAIDQYNELMDKQRMLRQKQHSGVELTQEDIDAYEMEEYKLYKNPIARKFLYAQREFEQVHDFISQYVIKTIELDRIPTVEDFASGGCGCGGNCGCGGGGSCGCGGDCGCGDGGSCGCGGH